MEENEEDSNGEEVMVEKTLAEVVEELQRRVGRVHTYHRLQENMLRRRVEEIDPRTVEPVKVSEATTTSRTVELFKFSEVTTTSMEPGSIRSPRPRTQSSPHTSTVDLSVAR